MLNFEGTLSNKISALGVAFLLTAIPLGMYGKVFFGMMQLNSILFIIGILLLFPYRNIFSSFVSIPGLIKLCMGFTILALFYESVSSYSENMHYLYNSLVLVLCIALGKSEYEVDFSINNVIKWTWILSAINAILTVFVISSGMYGLYSVYDPDPDKIIYDDLTAGSCCITNIACSLYLFYKDENGKLMKYIFLLFIFVDLYGVILTGKRTPLIVATFAILFFLKKSNIQYNLLNGRNVIISFIFICALIVFVQSKSDSIDLFTNTFERIGSGIHDMIYGTSSFDATNSTSIRYFNRMQAMSTISEFNLFEMLFGAGYMTQWIDMPVLQAYMDMGVIGFVLFSYLSVFYPIKVIITQKQMSPELLWAIIICCYGVISCLNSGHPYGHTRWLPIVVFYFVLNGERKNKIKYDIV